MPTRHALLIGNSTFRHNELARLSAPANDVRELASLLENPEIGDFKIELKLDVGLVDARRAIKRLFEDRHPNDLVLFYYSGHGLLDARGRFYLAMTETDPADPDAGSIDETWLRGVFDGSLSGRQVAILDCCHSGAFIPGGPTRKDGSSGPILTEKTFDPTGHGRFIMAATTATTSAFEQDGRSLYTRHLVEGLTGGAAAPDQTTVNVLDLHEFVKRRVAESVAPSMRPQLWRDAALNPVAHDLAIARNPHPRPKLPDDEIRKLWLSEPETVELAIFKLIEIAQGEGSLAEDARRVLGERLKASDSLSYRLGARIATFIGAVEVPKALAEAEKRAAEAEERAAEAEARLSTQAISDELFEALEKECARADNADARATSAVKDLQNARDELDRAVAAADASKRAFRSRERFRIVLILLCFLVATAGLGWYRAGSSEDPDQRSENPDRRIAYLREALNEAVTASATAQWQAEELRAELEVALDRAETAEVQLIAMRERAVEARGAGTIEEGAAR